MWSQYSQDEFAVTCQSGKYHWTKEMWRCFKKTERSLPAADMDEISPAVPDVLLGSQSCLEYFHSVDLASAVNFNN